jgi:hypothetical protein
MIILEWILEQFGGKLWGRFTWLRIGVGCGEHGTEYSEYIKGGRILD